MIYIPHLFTLLFVGLKLTGHIDWSWWLVLLPSYFVLALGLIVAAFALAAAGIAYLAMSKQERQLAKVARALKAYGDEYTRRFYR